MISLLVYWVMWLANRVFGAVAYWRLIHLTKNPDQAQRALLKRILRENEDSHMGRGMRFKGIKDVEQYQDQVALNTYRDLGDELRRQTSTGTQVLTAKRFVFQSYSLNDDEELAFPYTRAALEAAKKDVRVQAYAWLKHYGLWRGRAFSMLGTEPQRIANTGVPSGTTLGFIHANLPTFIRRRCFVPPEVMAIKQPADRYLCLAILALMDPRVTCLMTANPSTLVHLLLVINENFDDICKVLERGQWPDSFKALLDGKLSLRTNARRVRQLREVQEKVETLTFGDIWPRLRGVWCWTAGGCRNSIEYLRTVLPTGLPIVDIGLQTSAFIATLNIDTKTNGCIPTLHRNFFEFAERASWEAGFANLKMLSQLVVGQEYYLLVTTPSGLYRMQTDHVVKVTGKVHNTPTLEYVQQGSCITNIEGERVSESQVINAVESLNREIDCGIQEFILLSDAESRQYDLYLESDSPWQDEVMEASFDRALATENPDWLTKRLSERMQPPKIHRVPNGTINRLRTSNAHSGFDEPQILMSRLQLREPHGEALDAAVL